MDRFLLPMALALLASTSSSAQQPAAGATSRAASVPFEAGTPLGIAVEGRRTPMSANVKVYGAVVSAESCSYDALRDLIMVVNRGAPQTDVANDAFVSLLNHDGSVHTARWIGVNRNGLVLNEPYGSDVLSGKLYLADSDGGGPNGAPRTSVIRIFDVATGAPSGEIKVPESPWFNDIALAADGTIYATQTGSADGQVPMRVYKITPAGAASVLIEGAPLNLPNGIALDQDGNVVVINIGSTAVFTYSPAGKLLKTEQAAQSGNDGLVIMPDGTKYISSVRLGGVQRIRNGKAAELVAAGIPSAASMCLDKGAKQLVIPLNPNNAVAIVKL